jgi:hypothetical protein
MGVGNERVNEILAALIFVLQIFSSSAGALVYYHTQVLLLSILSYQIVRSFTPIFSKIQLTIAHYFMNIPSA